MPYKECSRNLIVGETQFNKFMRSQFYGDGKRKNLTSNDFIEFTHHNNSLINNGRKRH